MLTPIGRRRWYNQAMDVLAKQSSGRVLDPRRIEVVDRASAEVLQRMTGGQRVVAACRLFSSARAMLRQQLAGAHREWSPEQVERELARRVAGGTV